MHKKTRINLSFLYKDNLLVILLSFTGAFIIKYFVITELAWLLGIVWILISVPGFGFILTMVRFWRTPVRKIKAKPYQIVSPADGNVIYIKKIESNEIPIAIKDGELSTLNELTKTDLLAVPC